MTDAPTSATQRLPLLDSLRGFALSGVLLANLIGFSLYYFLAPADGLRLPSFPLDRWLDPAINIFVYGKFITLFSLLFGIGFAIQMQRDGGSRAGKLRYVRRLAILLAIGLIHAWLWWGDILRYYAVVGLALLVVWRWRPWPLAIAGIALALIPYPSTPLFISSGPAHLAQTEIHAATLTALRSPQWSVMLHGNFDYVQWWLVNRWGLALTVGGRLLIGAALGKSGVLQDPLAHARFWQRLLIASLPLGLVLSVLLQVFHYGMLPIAPTAERMQGIALKLVDHLATLSLGIGYMAAFVILFSRTRLRAALQGLAPVGRMALSNYLLQTLLGITVFYGVGLGVGARYGLVGVVVAWALLFTAQLLLSRWWLARYRFGPAEWLWRSLTYAQRQPLRIGASG